jgi:galacturan 1,4-alpha-galacturonidase
MGHTLLSFLAFLTLATGQSISHSSRNGRPTCTVYPGKTNNTDDVPTILKAFKDCGNGGNVVFPAGNTYHINTRLNPVVNDVKVDWQGEWLFSEDLDYWRNNSYHIEFQNHAAGFVLSGDHIHIDGYGTGGIHGNGTLLKEETLQ